MIPLDPDPLERVRRDIWKRRFYGDGFTCVSAETFAAIAPADLHRIGVTRFERYSPDLWILHLTRAGRHRRSSRRAGNR